MSDVYRWIDGIRILCPSCGKSQQGILVISNNDSTGNTEYLSIICHSCKQVYCKRDVLPTKIYEQVPLKGV
jgi:uncharacterized protein YbaR (Trm112 family)